MRWLRRRRTYHVPFLWYLNGRIGTGSAVVIMERAWNAGHVDQVVEMIGERAARQEPQRFPTAPEIVLLNWIPLAGGVEAGE